MPDLQSGGFTFGKRNNERPQEGGAFEMFIKNFDEGQHRIAVLEDNPENWMTVFEHYDHALKLTFPCAIREGADDCVGCSYPVEHEEWSDLDAHFPGMSWSEQKDERKKQDPGWGVRDVSKKYIFPCIDAKGYISIYKASGDLWKSFCADYKALGSLLNNEFVVTREGKGFGTTVKTTAVPGEVRKPKYAIPGQTEISAALGRKYLYALEKYGIDPGEVGSQPDPAPVQTPEPTGDPAKDALAGRRAQAEAKGLKPDTGPAAGGDEAQQQPPAEQPPVDEPVSSPAHGFIPREASTGEIKDWLGSLEPPVKFEPRAARQTLVKLAEDTMKDRGILPY